MEEKHRCEQCGKDFATSEGLAQHMRDKHGEGAAASSHELKEQRKKEREEQLRKEKEKTGRSKLMKKILIAGGALVGILILVYFLLIFTKGSEPRLADEDYILRTNLRSHSGVSMHIHPHITIRINGSVMEIPAEIGITDGVMSVIHTHDATGTIHLESPAPKDFNVGHFFFMWSRTIGEQKVFNATCVLQYCNDGNMTVKMLVNGKESSEYENFVMHDLDRIEIRYE